MTLWKFSPETVEGGLNVHEATTVAQWFACLERAANTNVRRMVI